MLAKLLVYANMGSKTYQGDMSTSPMHFLTITSHNRLRLVASVCSYGGLWGAGNRNYCAVATQGVSKRNPCWPGWRPAGGRGPCVYACHRALESSTAETDASDY